MVSAENDTAQQTYRKLFWLLLAIVTLFRMIFANSVGLGVDESHYYLYSRHLAWGYFDHPPMVAWLAKLTTLVSDNIFFIRLGPLLCSAGSIVLLRYLALALYRDERVSFYALVMLLLMPYQHLLMVGLLPDAPLNLFWCAALLGVWHGMKKESWIAWILAGVSFGGALLSKYHAVLLPFCLLLYLIISPRRRFWLAKIQPYAAVFIGLMIFLPNILWNARHDWISYAYQLGHGAGKGFDPGNLLAFLGGQLGAWSPLIFVFLIIVFFALLRDKQAGESDRFALWTSLPVFIFFGIMGAFGKILPHWPSVGWWTGSLAVTAVTLRRVSQHDRLALRWRRWWTAAAIVGLLMTAVIYVGLLYPIVDPLYTTARNVSLKIHQHLPMIKPLKPFKSKFDITNELYGWNEIAARVEALRAQMPRPEKTFVFTHKFYTASQLGVYLKTDTVATTLYRRFNQYRLWFSVENYRGWDALFIDEDRFEKGPTRYRPLFKRVDPEPAQVKVYRNDRHLARDIKVYRYYGFKGTYEK
jgi:4-amino-4-deoxy-L-arabinose transferase-like glycosyltransferase